MSNLLRIQYNGLTIDDTTKYTITEMQGLDGIPIRTAKDPLTAQNGGIIHAQYDDMRTIVLSGYCWGDTTADYLTVKGILVEAFSRTDTIQSLSVRMPSGAEKTIQARVTKPPMFIEKEDKVSYNDFSIELLAEDPYFTDTVETVYQCSLTQGGGITLPTTLPVSFNPGVNGSQTVVNSSDSEYYARFNILGPVTNPTVTNSSTGKQFQIETTLTSSDVLSIEKTSSGLYVLLNGTTSYFRYFKGEFFKFQKGTNVIRFSAASFDPTALLRFWVKNKYRSIE